jgi:conjugative transfer signal peptidase TraF
VPDLVAVDPPGVLATFLDARGYVPEGVPLMKRVLAVPGQTVCRTGLVVTVDGIEVGAALERDRAGRDLPVWQGCERVPAGAVFLMNWQVRDSLDGRYFGLTPTSQIIGRAVPLWTDENGDVRFQWRATTR